MLTNGDNLLTPEVSSEMTRDFHIDVNEVKELARSSIAAFQAASLEVELHKIDPAGPEGSS